MKRFLLSTVTVIGFSFLTYGQAPVANSQTVTIVEDSNWESILLTGSDPNGDPITFTVTTPPGIGTLSGTAPNVSYLTAADFSGTTTFQFVTNDGTQNSAPATVTINVLPINDAPVANSQTVTTWEDTALPITLTGSDVEGDPLSFVVITGPAHGFLTGTAPNLVYTPSANYNGTDAFTFRTSDPNGGTSSTATVNIDVLAWNDPPVAICRNITGYLNAAGSFNITAPMLNNGSTDDNGIVSMSVNPTSLSCANLGSNNVTLTVFDAEGLSSSCVGVVTILDSIHPVITTCPGAQNIVAGAGCVALVPDYTSLVTGTDNCGVTSITQVSPLPGASLSLGSTVPVTVRVTDASGNSSDCIFNLTVVGPEINVRGNAVTILDGDASATTADHSDFGSALACSGTILRTFRIENTGTVNLTLGSITITGAHAGDFVVTALPVSPVTPGGNTTFQVIFDPSATGSRNATVNIANDDCDENPYDFAIRGTGNPDIVNPLITCPGNISVNADPGLCSAVVTYVAPVGTDNCPSVVTTQTAGLPSGSAFPVGVTVNTFRATDGSGNTATCSFSVTVTDTQAPVLYTMNSAANSNAAATAYNDGWQTGDNDGTGFGAWSLAASTGNTSQAGFVTGSSTTNGAGVDSNGDQDINSGGRSLGMYANSAQATQAVRPLSSPLAIGSTLRLEFDNGTVDNGQIVGFQMQNSSGLSLGEVRLRGGQPGYELVDANGITPFTSIPFTDEGIIIEVTPTTAGQSSIKLTRKVNGATQTITSSMFPGGGNQVIQRIMIFNSNAGSGTAKQLYANNFQILAPSIGCPANISVFNSSGLCGATVVYTSVLARDNCNASQVVTQPSGLPSGSFFPVGTTLNLFTATDGSGNNVNCSFMVTVTDTTDPIASCQNVTVYLGNVSGTANISPAMINNGSSDNCGPMTMSLSQTSFSCANIGANNVTLTVNDMSGNSSTCTGVVTVLDSTHPVANCRNLTLQLNNSGTANLTPAMLNNGSTDNCGITAMSVSSTGFSCANMGTNNVTLTVTDASGNSSTCIGIVTVADTVRPVANCQNISVHLNPSGSAIVTGPMINNGSTDACGIASLVVSPSSFACANTGANNVTLTVTDVNGNSSVCTGVVTIIDTVRPTAICNDTTLYISSGGNLVITPAALNLGSSDACGIASMSVFPNTFSCSQTAVNTPVTLTVTDVNGNTGSCVSLVNIYENLAPVAICRNTTVYMDGSGNAAITAAMVNNGSYDECSIANYNLLPFNNSSGTYNCSNTGANPVTLQVFDTFGNMGSCAATVTVLDTTRPVVSCQNITVQLNPAGSATITPAMINNGSSDNCGIASMSVSPNSFSCANVGANSVTLTVTDNSGNSSSCTAVVTVGDTVRPVAGCQNISVHLNSSGTASVTAPMINNGSSDACGIASMGVAPNVFSCANVGANSVTLTVTDVNGNSSVCTSTVTIIDTVRPVAIAQNVTVTLSGGTATVTSAAINNGSSDACGIASMNVSPNTFNCSTLGANTVTLTVTDVNGNSSTATAIVTVLSDLVSSATVNSHVSCFGGSNGQATITTSGGAGVFSYSWSPAGGTAATASGLSAGTYTCIATDGGGCTTSSTVSITEPATALAAASVSGSILCNGGSTTVTVTGNGGTSPYTGEGTFTVTAGTYSYMVTDANGCIATTSITVSEPTALVPTSSGLSVLCHGGTTTVTVACTGGTAPYTGTGTFTETAGTFFYTVTDANGCAAVTSINISEPPVLGANSSASPILCNGGNTIVIVSGTGGTAPYSGTGVFTVTAGTYSYTVTDANGCTATTSITVTEPTVLSAGSSATAILCNGGTATVTVTGSGGTSPYSGAGTFVVGAGTYSYTVTDANGCTATTSVTVTEPTVLSAGSSATAILCNGGTATVTVTGSGGTSPYSGAGTFVVGAGTYSYTVTDANGCTATTSIIVTEPTAISTVVSTVNVDCNGNLSGSIDLTVSGGTSPYTYDWNSGAYTTEDLSGLGAGTYIGVLTDANGCTDGGTIVITEPTVLVAAVTASTNPATCGGTDGAIDISVSGGTAGYAFLWNNSATTEDLSGIAAGVYSCTVTDTNGCTATVGATLSDPNGPVVTLALVSDTMCLADAALTLTGESPAGGTFSGPGVTAGSFDPQAAGIGMQTISYTYTDVNGCTGSTSDSVYVDVCLAVSQDDVLQSGFSVFPNPNNGTFTVQINSVTATEVMIYDAQGKLVRAERVQPGTQHEMSMETPGVYMIMVITPDGQRKTQRVIVMN